METPIFLIVEATPNPENMTELQAYASQAPAITKKHGGVPVASYNVESAVYADQQPGVIVVVSFPNREAIDNLLVNDPDYQKLIPLRDKGFKNIRYLICSEKTQ